MTTRSPISIREVVSDALLTAGVLVLLFVAWQQWFTNVRGDTVHQQEQSRLLKHWGSTLDSNGLPESSKSTGSHSSYPDPVRKVRIEALMYIPKLRSHLWGTPVVYGTSLHSLAHGVGRYPSSPGFGGIGNLGLAGHRTTHGRPFRHLDELKRGDIVAIRTQKTWFIYRLDRTTIVNPDDGWVAQPHPYANAPQRMITLTTCNPLHSARQRLVWWGHFVRSQSDSSIPRELLKGA
ncbi:MAG: hypothetical protein RL745_491 [Actinomycetota bacterium]